MKKFIPLIFLLFLGFAKAQTISELEATPSVLSEPNAILQIQEISFKNKQADWVKMVYTSPSGKPINLKGISFADDKIFKTIEDDFILASEQEILLTFKSEEDDEMPYLYSGKSGLTGTTEQFIIYDQNSQVLDAVCWTSATPTESEIKEQAELFEQEGWISGDIFSCLPSDTVKTDEIIKRQGFLDTNSSQDWIQPEAQEAEATETPPLQAVRTPEAEAEEDDIQDTAVVETSTPLQSPERVAVITPTAGTTKDDTSSQKKSTKSSSTSYRNGDTSTDIIISEILPNPDGNDSKREWVELTNMSDKEVNLGNWIIDDSEDGSKPYTLSDTLTIGAGSALIIESADSKLSLGNKEDSIRLFDFNGEPMDEALYEEAPSGQSYSRIAIEREDGTTLEEWLWTTNLTPGEPNPSFRQLTAEVIDEPHFEQNYTLKVRDQKDQEHVIIFDEELIAGPLAKATFTRGTTLLLTIEPIENRLVRFEVLSAAQEENPFPSFFLPSVIATILLAAGASFFLVHKKFPWKEGTKKL